MGVIQFGENDDPQYRHASIDLFLGTRWQGQGLGPEAIARESGCSGLVLDSGVQRTRAHRFYFREGFVIHAYNFGKPLA